jgi:NAD(P)-dependent dehydrogenase (short-subunit alcohol dehydrogenase family)
VVAEVEAGGGAAVFVETDVTRPEASEVLVAACVAEFGSLDFAVNNAGTTGLPGSVVNYPLDAWRATMAVNLDGVFFAMRAELPVMVAAGRGAIVNVASGAGLVGFAGLPAYVASKHGVVGLTKSAAIEFAGQNIRINAMCPGTTWTPMMEVLIEGNVEMEKVLRAASPYGRMARPEEMAEAAVWLCSDAASFVNGVALPVDAGRVAQ